MESRFRIEHDFLGERKIPAAAYWGVHTARAVENFPISGTRISAMPDLVRALAHVKKAATRANADLGAAPEKVNEDAFAAWMFRIKPDNPSDLDKLLDAAAYEKAAS